MLLKGNERFAVGSPIAGRIDAKMSGRPRTPGGGI